MFHSGETIAREECAALLPRFGGAGLLPAVATDAGSGAVLMLAWMKAAASIPSSSQHAASPVPVPISSRRPPGRAAASTRSSPPSL